MQALHLLILHAGSGTVLAAHYGSRWLLPVVACTDRVRADPVAVRWADDRGLECDVVGQWLGRVGVDSTDWIMVLRATRQVPVMDSPLAWTPVDALASTPALLDYQRWALERLVGGGVPPSVPGPFGRIDWIDDAMKWIGGVVGAVRDRATPYRSSPHEVVLGVHTRRRPVFFKGLWRDRGREAMLTRTLERLDPSSFARTLALEERADGCVWWLSAACPGRAAADGRSVARALAAVQQRVAPYGPILPELRQVDLEAAFQWATALIGEDEWIAAMKRQIGSVLTADVPVSWIAMDLDPTNVLVDRSGEVRFIDLDDSFLGPAPLAMAVFAKRSPGASLYEVYERSWSPPLANVDWPAFEAAAALVEAWLGWERVERNTRNGVLYGALEVGETRIRDRLRRCVHLSLR